MKLLIILISVTFYLNSYAQSGVVDCGNITYLEDTFYVSLNNDTLINTVYYNDPVSMIYPANCLILDTNSLIEVNYFTGVFNTENECSSLTYLAQDSERDTIDFLFLVTFNSTNFLNNTIVNGDLILGDANSSCSTPITIILQNSALNSNELLENTPKQLIKIVDVLGRETPFKPNTPLLYIYNDGTVERKMIIKE